MASFRRAATAKRAVHRRTSSSTQQFEDTARREASAQKLFQEPPTPNLEAEDEQAAAPIPEELGWVWWRVRRRIMADRLHYWGLVQYKKQHLGDRPRVDNGQLP